MTSSEILRKWQLKRISHSDFIEDVCEEFHKKEKKFIFESFEEMFSELIADLKSLNIEPNKGVETIILTPSNISTDNNGCYNCALPKVSCKSTPGHKCSDWQGFNNAGVNVEKEIMDFAQRFIQKQTDIPEEMQQVIIKTDIKDLLY